MAEQWIIVGAGSAGCVVASRLSENPDRHVILVDDGPDLAPGQVPAGISGPSFFAALAEPGRIHENLMATRTTGGAASVYQRGRGIGGSSAVNAMVALRGSEALYRNWGWTDTDAAWDQVAIPAEPATPDELGPVDRALRAAEPATEGMELTRVGGRRVTSAEAYLWPALHRPNLTVRADAGVDTLIVDGRRVRGIRFADGTEAAADHVVMAAGAIHTPTILLRSGIDTAGIGEGLQDHPSAVFVLQLSAGVVQNFDGLPIGSVLHEWHGDDLVQLLPMSHLSPDAPGLGALMMALMTPRGRAGTVTIDASGDPVIDFAMLQDDRDVQALAVGARRTLEVLDHAAFADIVEQVFIDDAGTTTDALSTDAAIEGWLRSNCADYVHASSTCAMGTVVDDRGAVIGYEGLSVCDASIFPTIPDANTHLPTTMAAERLCRRGFRP